MSDYLIWDETFPAADDTAVKKDWNADKKQQRKPKIRLKRCVICRQTIESDGYGEWVHSNTGLYGEYDEGGVLTHVASR